MITEIETEIEKLDRKRGKETQFNKKSVINK
jgi:hypothetical protein